LATKTRIHELMGDCFEYATCKNVLMIRGNQRKPSMTANHDGETHDRYL